MDRYEIDWTDGNQDIAETVFWAAEAGQPLVVSLADGRTVTLVPAPKPEEPAVTPTAKLATIWLFHANGREQVGHNDAERAWAEAVALPARSHERVTATLRFNPVEINIAIGDVPRAVAKWERIAGLKGVCHVEITNRLPGMTVNKLYA